METHNAYYAAELKKAGLRPSHQRVLIMEYLSSGSLHPTADRIWRDLMASMPTLSKSTVYNTLKVLTGAGLVAEVDIDEGEARYEMRKKSHGHFKCMRCGSVYDFGIDIDRAAASDLAGFRIEEKCVYFKGLCESCLKK